MKKMAIALLLTAFFSSASFAAADGPKEAAPEISVSDAMVMHGKKEALFLDVREPHEYAAGHIEGAINIPQGLLQSGIGEKIPDKNARIVVYCRTVRRSALAAQTLSEMGYNNVLRLKGGWQALKLETE